MRISDWSSDVCSPICDLGGGAGQEAFLEAGHLFRLDRPLDHLDAAGLGHGDDGAAGDAVEETIRRRRVQLAEIGRASCRERVCQYVSISGGAVSLKKKQIKTHQNTNKSKTKIH